MKEKRKDFYVYLYIDPRTDLPFYVGKGSNGRAYVHLTSNARTYFISTLKKMRKEGLEPIIQFYDTDLTEQDAFEEEIRLIKKYGRKNNGTGCLTNLTDGGEGCSGHVLSEEEKKKISEAKRGKSNGREGYKHTEETLLKMSEVAKGRVISKEQRIKISNTLTGRPRPEEVKQKISASTKGRQATYIMTEEQKQKISNSLKGKGHKQTEETKRKISEGHKRRKES